MKILRTFFGPVAQWPAADSIGMEFLHRRPASACSVLEAVAAPTAHPGFQAVLRRCGVYCAQLFRDCRGRSTCIRWRFRGAAEQTILILWCGSTDPCDCREWPIPAPSRIGLVNGGQAVDGSPSRQPYSLLEPLPEVPPAGGALIQGFRSTGDGHDTTAAVNRLHGIAGTTAGR